MSDWKPKVGEECLVSAYETRGFGEYKKCIIRGIDKNGAWVVVDNKHIAMNISLFKFKPKPSQAEELTTALRKYDFNRQPIEAVAKDLIKLGYRKVEPITMELFFEKEKDLDVVDFYSYLEENNHIVIKGE